jgi:hypothetical protein
MRQENNNMIISINSLEDGRKVLAGAIPGKNLLTKLITQISRKSEPEPLFLDLQHIEVATSSYLREGILAFRDYCINGRLNIYPVITNAQDTVLEELETLLEFRGDALISCNLDKKGNISSAKVLGVLEEKQEITLEAVLTNKIVDATTLANNPNNREQIGVTGWNNRLASLAAKGILMERKRGRVKLYQPVLEIK